MLAWETLYPESMSLGGSLCIHHHSLSLSLLSVLFLETMCHVAQAGLQIAP